VVGKNGGWLGRVGKDTNQGLQYGNRTDLMKTERIGWFLVQNSNFKGDRKWSDFEDL
jgi:hypothetical protein